MTLPTPIQTGAITGRFIDPLGRPLKGNVILSYDRQVLLAPGATPPTTIIARTKAFALDDQGDLSADGIILSDSPGLRRAGFTVKAVFALTDQDGQKRPRGVVHFQLSQAQPTKDLTLVSTDEPDGGYPVFPEVAGLPGGGTTGQVLTKASDDDYDADWEDASGGGGAVDSVNGHTGAVELGAHDVDAYTRSESDEAVQGALDDVAAISDQIAQPNGIAPLGSDGKVPGSFLPAESVTSVNTMTGDVTLDATDVGALTEAETSEAIQDYATPSPFRLAPEHDIPVITFEAYDVWSDAPTIPGGPGRFREKRQGAAETAAGGAQSSTADLDLTGSSHFRYHGFPQATDFGANSSRSVQTGVKPGGNSQFANWLFGMDYITSAPVVKIPLNPVTTNGILAFITVNGLAISERATIFEAAAGTPTQAVLTFPDARPRTLRFEGLNQNQGRFGGVEVPAGYSIVKASNPIQRPIAFIGDSFVNGNGVAPDAASETETFVWRLGKLMGADEIDQVGVGGTGFVNGGGDGSAGLFGNRVAATLALNPKVLVFSGGYNDTTTGLAAAIASALAAAASVPERYLIFTGSDPAVGAVYQAAAAAAGIPFVWPDIAGIPKLPADGVHPTYEGHQMLADAVWNLMQHVEFAPYKHTHKVADITDLIPVRILAASDPDPVAGAPAGFYFKQIS